MGHKQVLFRSEAREKILHERGAESVFGIIYALDEELDIQIPESDYPKLLTLQGCIEILTARTATVHTKP